MPNEFRTFPDSELEALAYLYVKSQDLSGKSPSEIHTMYREAYYEITKDHCAKRHSGWYDQKRAEAKQP